MRDHCCHGKVMIVTVYECVFVGLGIQQVKRMRLIILSSMVSATVLLHKYAFTLSHKRHDFPKNDDMICVLRFSLQISSEKFLIMKRIQLDIVINAKTSLCKVPVIFVIF